MNKIASFHPGLWLALAVVAAIGIWPIPAQDAALREVSFTVLIAIVMATSLNVLMGYTATFRLVTSSSTGWAATLACTCSTTTTRRCRWLF